MRDAIVDFKSSKKPIIAYLEYGGEQEFYLASACDKVFLMPTASLDLTGMASYELFLRGTLDKIGAYPDALHIGEYKTASNQMTEHTFTPAHREMAESLNRDLYEQLVKGIASGRQKQEAEVRTLIDHGPFLPEDAVRAGLIDDVAYEDELDDKVSLGKGASHFVEHDEYRSVSPGSLGLNRGPRIAVLYAAGIISSGESSYDAPQGEVVGSDTIIRYLRKARSDDTIKAIVLRIDSPGGSAIASDVIWREVELTRVKPVRLDVQRLRVLPIHPVANAAQFRELAQVLRCSRSAGHLRDRATSSRSCPAARRRVCNRLCHGDIWQRCRKGCMARNCTVSRMSP